MAITVNSENPRTAEVLAILLPTQLNFRIEHLNLTELFPVVGLGGLSEYVDIL